MFSQRDYYEYATAHNLTVMVPYEEPIDSSMGPIEREEMRRCGEIDFLCEVKHKKEKRRNVEED